MVSLRRLLGNRGGPGRGSPFPAGASRLLPGQGQFEWPADPRQAHAGNLPPAGGLAACGLGETETTAGPLAGVLQKACPEGIGCASFGQNTTVSKRAERRNRGYSPGGRAGTCKGRRSVCRWIEGLRRDADL